MAKTIHIYTDASSKDTTMFPQGVKRTVKVGVIVINSNIVDIYYNRAGSLGSCYTKSHKITCDIKVGGIIL